MLRYCCSSRSSNISVPVAAAAGKQEEREHGGTAVAARADQGQWQLSHMSDLEVLM